MQTYFSDERQNQIGTALLAFLAILVIFFVFKTINEIRVGSYMSQQYGYNTITVAGEGEAFAIPDTATFSFSVRERASSVAAAQDSVTKKMDAILEALEEAGVDEDNIKTINYSVYPRYEYQTRAAQPDFYPPVGQEVLVGYEVSHTNEVKIKDATKAGELLTAVGGLGATDVSGISFTIEDESAILAEAQAEAIEDAKEKAKVLADELDVRLIRLMSYYEDGSGAPIPYYGKGGEMSVSRDANEDMAIAVEAQVTPGENRYFSRVNLVYQIR